MIRVIRVVGTVALYGEEGEDYPTLTSIHDDFIDFFADKYDQEFLEVLGEVEVLEFEGHIGWSEDNPRR